MYKATTTIVKKESSNNNVTSDGAVNILILTNY